MSKKTKATHPRREKKAEKPLKRAAKARRPPPKAVQPQKPAEKGVEERESIQRYLIAVRVDGAPTVKPPEQSTLDALRMKTRFSAVLLQDNPSVRGMLQRAKDHVTWGEAKKDDIKLLLSSRARTSEGLGISSKFVKQKTTFAGLSELLSELHSGKFTLAKLWEIGVKPVFRLHPPRGGFAKSSKRAFTEGGELGYRKDGLRDLLTKMC